MKNLICFLLAVSLFSSCKKKECNIDPQFHDKLNCYIDSIERIFYIERNHIDESVDITRMREILFYLIFVTGIDDAEVFEFEHPLPPKKHPGKLIKQWRQWYKTNKCHFTLKKADSIYFEASGVINMTYDLLDERGIDTFSRTEEYIDFLEDSLRQEFRKNYK